MSSKQELEAEVEHWKREAKANQLLLNWQRVEEAALKAAAKPKKAKQEAIDETLQLAKVKPPAKAKPQPKAKKAPKSR